MNWSDLFDSLYKLIPLLSTVAGHPELGALAEKLIEIGEEEIARRMAEKGQTRAEVLADADATWQRAITGADELGKLGHEDE